MIFTKKPVGSCTINDMQIGYYLIEKNGYYGVAIEEYHNGNMLCDYEYISTERDCALSAATLLKKGEITITTFTSVLDDYLGIL